MRELLKRTWAEVDLDALGRNFRAVREHTASGAKVCCVVKADAYGHGAVRVARELEALGGDWFAVSNLEEALQLRQGGVKKPVLILGFTPPEEAVALAEQEISQCVYSPEYALSLSRAAEASGAAVHIHLKIDTGMSRLGFSFQDGERDREALEQAYNACNLPGLIPEGIFTHFAVSDEGKGGREFTLRQFSCFAKAVQALEERGIAFQVRHCANSAAVFDYPQTHLDMVRAGIVLYGLLPSGVMEHPLRLWPVLSLRSVVSQVRTLPAGATVSYGRTFTAPGELQVATIPVGYADGYPRLLSRGKVQVLIQGRRCPVLGRICMDQLMADVTGLSKVSIGDSVTLIGRDGGEEITADELAGREDTISYEVVCGVSKRVPRVYWKDGKAESVYDGLGVMDAEDGRLKQTVFHKR